MKRFLLSAISSTMLLTGGQSFAADLNCPATSKIQAVQFSKAFDMGVGSAWILLSDAFRANSADWGVGFMTILPDAKTPAQAIAQGSASFSVLSGQLSSEPKLEVYGEQTSCTYLETDTSVVVAVNPPAQDIPSLGLSRKLLHRA